MALNKNGTGKVNGYRIGPEADLRGANLGGERIGPGANLRGADLRGANLSRTKLIKADLRGANLEGAILERADLTFAELRGAHLRGADLTRTQMRGANLEGSDLTDAILMGTEFVGCDLKGAVLARANMWGSNLEGSDLTDANLEGAALKEAVLIDANFTDANLTDANMAEALGRGAIFTGATLLGAVLPQMPRMVRSYGAMTGPILKIGKADSPARAAEFKKRYPTEFERLKADTSGRDFTDTLRDKIRDKYRTPFEWEVTEQKYKSRSQRVSPQPNTVLLFNVDTEQRAFTPHQRELLEKLSESLHDDNLHNHPIETAPLLTIGWIRYAQDDDHRVLLIEEVQSDVEFVRRKGKGNEHSVEQLEKADFSPEDHREVIDLLAPYSSRFYEDAIGLVFQEAEALGYTVEMLGYGDKEAKAPFSFYTELPKRMGMGAKRVSEVPTVKPLKDKVSFYKPNPSKPSRRRR